jgi:acyl carrier protein phosphodiesterase
MPEAFFLMNYLAHALLSHATPGLLIGGMLGDFVKGSLGERYDPEIRAGILLHRGIDRYTDAHDLVHASRARISLARRRFAGILVDVFYDHFLARHWARYTELPLEEFTQQVYATLVPHAAGFPERLQRILPRMAADDWLASYAEIEAVDAALHGIARRFARFTRFARAPVLAGGVQELLQNYTTLESDFLAFFPELHRYAAEETRRQLGAALDVRPAPRQHGAAG